MAFNVYFDATANGTDLAETANATTVQEMAGDDVSAMVECLSFETGLETPISASGGAGARRGRRVCRPVEIVFRATGKTWPQWFQACDRNEQVEGTFHLYRTGVTGGAIEKAGKVEIERGSVLSVRLESPSTLDPDTASLPPLLHVSIAYQTLTVESEDGTEYQIDCGR